MRRAKRYLDSRSTDSRDRWLVSYADFITLLFAFFVVMYALSTVNEGKYRQLGQAIGTAFGVAESAEPLPIAPLGLTRSATARAEAAAASHRERLAEAERSLGEALAPLIAEGNARIVPNGRGVSLEIGAGFLFASGQALLREGAREALATLAAVLRDGDQPIEVEGHTDDVPIHSAQFPSNWELSAARASAVVRVLLDLGVAPVRLAAIGFGEFRPVESNGSAEGRARNRRVSITLVMPEPVAASAALPAGRSPQSFLPMEFPVRPK